MSRLFLRPCLECNSCIIDFPGLAPRELMGRQLTHRIEVKVCTNKRLANWEDVERNVALWKPPCFHVFWISVPQAYSLWAGLRGSSTVTLWTVFASALTTACPRTWAVLTCPYNLPALELMGNWLGRFSITHFRRASFFGNLNPTNLARDASQWRRRGYYYTLYLEGANHPGKPFNCWVSSRICLGLLSLSQRTQDTTLQKNQTDRW